MSGPATTRASAPPPCGDRPPRQLELLRATYAAKGPLLPGEIERDGCTTIVKGTEAERRAARLLVRAGLTIVECNYRTKLGELDIIAREGTTLVFVEVRSRRDGRYGSALETVNWRKQRMVTRVALQYLAWRRPVFSAARFDVVAITGDGGFIDPHALTSGEISRAA